LARNINNPAEKISAPVTQKIGRKTSVKKDSCIPLFLPEGLEKTKTPLRVLVPMRDSQVPLIAQPRGFKWKKKKGKNPIKDVPNSSCQWVFQKWGSYVRMEKREGDQLAKAIKMGCCNRAIGGTSSAGQTDAVGGGEE